MKNKEELQELADSLTESEIEVLLPIILDDHPMLILNRSDVEFVGVPIADYTRLVQSETNLKVIYALMDVPSFGDLYETIGIIRNLHNLITEPKEETDA